MPFNQALFWIGLTALGTGMYYLLEPAVKRRYSIGLTALGALACAYTVYRDSHPELPVIHLWVILLSLTWVFLGYVIYLGRFRTLPPVPDKPKEQSKLVIHSANYKAIGGGGKAYNVTEFMRQIITGNSLVFDVENYNFWFGDNNFVPKDPCSGTVKRLQVTYSYDGGGPRTIEREEHSRLVLPEDSETRRLSGKIEQLKDTQVASPSAVDALKQSGVLRSLPVYFQDLQLKLLVADVGTTLDLSTTTLFLKLSLTSDDDTGLRDMKVTFSVYERDYIGTPLDDLSDWILQTPFKNPQYPYKTIEEGPIDTVSLWRDLQHNGLKAGLVKTGWVGIQIPDVVLAINKVQKVKIEVTKPQPKRTYRFYFSVFPETYERVIDAAFRHPH